MLNQERGKIATLYVNFLTQTGEEATTVVDPKITIRHISTGNTTITDINEAALSFGIETMYYFKWNIPLSADLGVYTVEYSAIVDGTYAEANETIEVLEFIGSPICTDDYTTIAKVASYLGVAESTIQQDWIDWATSYVDMYTCNKFCPVTVTEKYDIERSSEEELFLDHFPIINVIELRDEDTILNPTDYLVYNDEGRVAFRDDFGFQGNIFNTGFFSRGRQKVSIIYTYGYATLPKEIEWATTVLASTIAITSLQQSGTTSVGDISEEQIGEYRRKRSTNTSGSVNFASSIEESKLVDNRIAQDIFSVKNVLLKYRLSTGWAV